MKITSQEEYGLRILLRVAGCSEKEGMSIPQLSEVEGLSSHYVAKLTRILRLKGFINSTPGSKGGYVLAMPADKIVLNEVLKALDGPLFDNSFCGSHMSSMKFCTNSVDCSSRSLWQMMQFILDDFLNKITLSDLVKNEEDSNMILSKVFQQHQVQLEK
ncbi:MAG: Rrf2 family transcriptional regulator [Flavisolibacter sp.]|jgi:Rrf2 family protein|nr:Rrf2 family transcriptional regulator [Flavisolibacter sp.]